MGMKIPEIRAEVQKIPEERYAEILARKPATIDEILARGMMLARLPYEEMLGYFDSQVDYICDWCTCDIFCSELKKVRRHREEFLAEKLMPLLKDEREFAVRVGLVFLKCYYVDSEHLNLIFDRVENLKDRDEYYIKMAIAWLVSECFIKFPEPTLKFLKTTKLPKWTFNKSISKICDSFRVDQETKIYLKTLRR